MKILLNAFLLIVCFTLYPAFSYAAVNSEVVAKGIADGAKKVLLKEYGEFPIKLDDDTYMLDITSDKQTIIYDYKTSMSSDILTPELLTENVKLILEDEFCDDADVLNLFKKSNINFLFRYQFSDKKTIPINLTIEDICD